MPTHRTPSLVQTCSHLLLLSVDTTQVEPYGHQPGDGHFDEAYRAVLDPFWRAQKQEISQASTDLSEYKSQQLPLARIKKVCVTLLYSYHPVFLSQ